MVSKYSQKNVTWIDLENPTEEEIDMLTEEYSLPTDIARDLMHNSYRPKAELHEGFLYLIMHFPGVDAHGKVHDREIDFVINKNTVITTHYETINPLHEYKKRFETDMLLNRQSVAHAGFLFVDMATELYKNTATQIEHIERKIIETEYRIFEGNESKMVNTISKLNRELLDFKQAIRLHGSILKSCELASKDFFGEGFGYYFATLLGEHDKIKTMVEASKELILDIRDTNDSLLSSKTNEIIKKLTIINFTMLPLTLLASIFMMNTSFPLIQTLGEFYIVIGAMCLTAIVMFIYFKSKKWL